MTDLFAPYGLHGITLPNRIVMSAMTRTRASENGVPTDVMREYFTQRTSSGLITTDCTAVSKQARGVIRGPGVHRDDQIQAWRRITDAVHEAGGRIYEFVATFGLLGVIWGCARRRSAAVPFAVGAYITAAYWFTASTSFANPAVTLARGFTDSFAGIRPIDIGPFVLTQLLGAAAATLLFRWLVPSLPESADRVVVPQEDAHAAPRVDREVGHAHRDF